MFIYGIFWFFLMGIGFGCSLITDRTKLDVLTTFLAFGTHVPIAGRIFGWW